MATKNNNKKQTVLLVPLPAQGHAPPLINLAVKLADRGFSIVLLNLPSIHKQVSERLKPPHGCEIKLDSIAFDLPIPKALDADALYSRSALLDAFHRLEAPFERYLQESGLLADHQLACIIADYHVTWTAAIAEKHSIAHACFWSGSAAWSLVEYHIPRLHKEGFIPVPDAHFDDFDQQQLISFIPGMDPFKPADLPFTLHKHMRLGMPERELFTKLPRFHKDDWIVANTFDELEPRQVEAMRNLLGTCRYMAIGPLLSDISLEDEQLACLDWLQTRPQSSVLYISFGSLAILSQKQFEQLALALESAEQSFLWVIRPEFLGGGRISEDFYKDFASRTARSGRSMIVRWAPQQRVLSHASIGGFLTHCGWNSLLESIWHGVPMLGWACNSDQNLNCRLILEGNNIGISIPRSSREDLVAKEDILKSVSALMTDMKIKESIVQLKDSARQAVAKGGTSHSAFEQWIAGIKNKNSKKFSPSSS